MNIKTIDWSYYTGEVPGYGDCRAVVGEYACLLPDRHVESFLGIAPLADGENVNYLRIPHNPGDGRMAGGGQSTDRTLEWQVTRWAPMGAMFGPNAVIYGAGDRFVQVTSRGEYQATGGWRYVDVGGQLHDCVSTHDDVARGIYEWTDFGDVAIGQGADGIAVVSFPGEPLRRLDPRPPRADGKPLPESDARFMRSDREGDQFGIAIVELKGRKTYFVWCSLAELRALPFVTDAPPIEPPVEPPVPEYDYDLKDKVEAERAKYPAGELPVDAPAKILNAVGWNENARIGSVDWGLSVKPTGNRVPSPQGVDVAYDILHNRIPRTGDPHGLLFDAMTGELLCVPTWGQTTYHGNPQGRPWLAPVRPDGVPPIEPPGPGPTHRYDGGGNDTGTCDQCGQPRVSDIHRVPEGTVPHDPWLGEDGVGDCDLCFQPVNAPIHGDEPPPPSDDLEARVRELETWRDAIRRVT